jgi:hypothetical protein
MFECPQTSLITIATTVVTTMPIRSAPRTCWATSAEVITRPIANTRIRSVLRSEAIVTIGAPPSGWTTMPALTKPMNAMKQPDADPDRAFEVHRDRVEDRLPETGQHQDRDEDPLGDDHAHCVGERQPVVRDEREGDERVQPEPCGERERVVRVDAHRDRHDAGDERGHREDLGEREALLLQPGCR